MRCGKEKRFRPTQSLSKVKTYPNWLFFICKCLEDYNVIKILLVQNSMLQWILAKLLLTENDKVKTEKTAQRGEVVHKLKSLSQTLRIEKASSFKTRYSSSYCEKSSRLVRMTRTTQNLHSAFKMSQYFLLSFAWRLKTKIIFLLPEYKKTNAQRLVTPEMRK